VIPLPKRMKHSSILLRTQGLTILVLLAAALLSCGKKEEAAAPAPGASSAAAPAPPPLQPGSSSNLTRSKTEAFYNFDSLGPVSYPAAQKTITLPGDSEISVSGWALDASKKGPAGAVDVVLDGNPFSANYGLDRTDVAAHFNRPDYTKSGFQLLLARGQFTKGSHGVSIRVISSDKKSYSEGPVVQFTVN